MTRQPFTLQDLHDLARRWCPPKASWVRGMKWIDHWGAAHELGHALLATPEQRDQRNYGLCALGDCACPHTSCHIVELAAMRISRRFVTVIGRVDLADQEYDDTDYIDKIDVPGAFHASWLLIRKKRLWPLPTTRAGLEGLLQRRLRRPNPKQIAVKAFDAGPKPRDPIYEMLTMALS